MQDPECYDRRSEKKKIKNGMKLKLRHEFSVSTNTTTTTALLLIVHILLYSSTPPTPPPTSTTTLLTTTSSTTPIDCLLYML